MRLIDAAIQNTRARFGDGASDEQIIAECFHLAARAYQADKALEGFRKLSPIISKLTEEKTADGRSLADDRARLQLANAISSESVIDFSAPISVDDALKRIEGFLTAQCFLGQSHGGQPGKPWLREMDQWLKAKGYSLTRTGALYVKCAGEDLLVHFKGSRSPFTREAINSRLRISPDL